MKTVRIIAALAALLICLASLSACGGYTPTVAEIQKKGTITMATNASFPPFEFTEGVDENGKTNYVGIDIEIWEVDGAGLSANSRYRSPKHQALIYAISYGMYNSDIARTLGVDSNANKGIVNDARITELLNEGVRTLDPEKVKAIYGEIQDIVHDKAYYLPLFYRSKMLVWRKGFKGVTPDPLSRTNFRYAYMEE